MSLWSYLVLMLTQLYHIWLLFFSWDWFGLWYLFFCRFKPILHKQGFWRNLMRNLAEGKIEKSKVLETLGAETPYGGSFTQNVRAQFLFYKLHFWYYDFVILSTCKYWILIGWVIWFGTGIPTYGLWWAIWSDKRSYICIYEHSWHSQCRVRLDNGR